MHRITSLFACVMLLLTVWSGPAHAVQLAGCDEPIASEMLMHAEGDCDEVPSDQHKAYPHHHDGCHGEHVGAAVRSEDLIEPMLAAQAYAPAHMAAFVDHRADTTLRPPRA